jgi:hypothetical protein
MGTKIFSAKELELLPFSFSVISNESKFVNSDEYPNIKSKFYGNNKKFKNALICKPISRVFCLSKLKANEE